jgi:hypothetical protein
MSLEGRKKIFRKYNKKMKLNIRKMDLSTFNLKSLLNNWTIKSSMIKIELIITASLPITRM